MNDRRVFKIPMERHLVAFVKEQFFPGETEPVIVNDYYFIGKLFRTALQDNYVSEDDIIEGDSTLEIKLSARLLRLSPTIGTLARINRYLEEYFNQTMITWVTAQTTLGNNRYQSLFSFLEYYGIQDPGLHTRYYQYLKRIDIRRYINARRKQQTTKAY